MASTQANKEIWQAFTSLSDAQEAFVFGYELYQKCLVHAEAHLEAALKTGDFTEGDISLISQMIRVDGDEATPEMLNTVKKEMYTFFIEGWTREERLDAMMNLLCTLIKEK